MSVLGNNLLAQYYVQQNNGYVRDGLVCWLDGINNTRHGHNTDAPVWEDLSGNNNDWTISSGVTILDNCVQKNSATTRFIAQISTPNFLGNTLLSNHTIECVVKTLDSLYGCFFIGNTNSAKGFMEYQFSILLTQNSSQNSGFGFGHVSQITVYSLSCGYDTNGILCYLNGVPKTITHNTTISNSNNNAYLGGRASGSVRYCAIYSFRVYNRILTEKEVEQNYNADCKRFNLTEGA